MNTNVIIIAIGMWEEYTKPCILSIKKFERTVNIICVNNGNKISKDQKEEVENISWVDTEELVSYSKAINLGIREADIKSFEDWFIVINNDVLCKASFLYLLKVMQWKNALYGNLLHRSHRKFDFDHPWVDGWLFAFQYKFIRDVGLWDENFKTAAFEDADISYRAWNNEYTVEKSYLPFLHLETHMRKDLENFTGDRLDNLNYLLSKYNLKGTGKNLKCYLY